MNISAFGLSLESTSWELSYVQALVTQNLNILPMQNTTHFPAANSHPWWKGYYRIQKQSRRTARFSTPALVLLRYSNQCPVLTLSSWCCERGSTESFSGPRQKDCFSPASPNPSTPYQVHSSEDVCFPSRSGRKAPMNGGKWKYQNKRQVANCAPTSLPSVLWDTSRQRSKPITYLL